MCPHRIRTVVCGKRSLLTGIQNDELCVRARAKHIDEMLRAIVHDGQDGGGNPCADIFGSTRDLDVPVFIERTQTDVGKDDVRFILGDMDGIDFLLRAIREESVELVVNRIRRDVQNTVVVVAHGHGFGELGEESLRSVQFLVACRRILRTSLADIDGTCPDGRLCRDGFDVVVEMPAEDEIHATPLRNRYNIPVVERIRIGMMCDEDAPHSPLCVLAYEIRLHP